MNPLNLDDVNWYVNEHIVDFHQRRIKSLEELKLNKLLKKNPYLFRAKNILSAGELIEGLLDAFLSSSEEKLFGDFLENLAVFVAGQTCNGRKSTAPGVDLEFEEADVYYVVSIKSGPNWGNSSQQSKLADDLQKAAIRLKQSHLGINVQPVLGICYGNSTLSILRTRLAIEIAVTQAKSACADWYLTGAGRFYSCCREFIRRFQSRIGIADFKWCNT